MNEKNFFNLKDMVIMALFAALTCVLAPLAVPIGPVPISLTTLVIILVCMCLDGSGQPSRTLYTCCLAWLDFRYSPDLKAALVKLPVLLAVT